MEIAQFSKKNIYIVRVIKYSQQTCTIFTIIALGRSTELVQVWRRKRPRAILRSGRRQDGYTLLNLLAGWTRFRLRGWELNQMCNEKAQTLHFTALIILNGCNVLDLIIFSYSVKLRFSLGSDLSTWQVACLYAKCSIEKVPYCFIFKVCRCILC